MNVATISGHVGGDPQLQYFESGSSKASFSVAVKGFKKDETHWISVEVWGKSVEYVGNYIRKGSLVLCSGSLKEEKWQDKETGKQRSKIILNCDRIEAPKSAQSQGSQPEGEIENYDDHPF